MHIRRSILCFPSALGRREIIFLVVAAPALSRFVDLEVCLNIQGILPWHGLGYGVPMDRMWRRLRGRDHGLRSEVE